MLHLTDHTQYLRSSFHLFGGMHLLETKGLQGQFLTLGPVDATLDLCDSDLCHDWYFVYRGCVSFRNMTHPRYTANDGPSAGEPVVRFGKYKEWSPMGGD